ncbi:MAG: winged helix-turn-helix domain-containing protein [Clostridiales bacterium]|nr:winged helix-turn-helix domain-containing protein [Clostridiales bacterium]
MNDTIIKIQMLGGFSIVSGNIRIEERAKRSSKIWKLLQYLIAHRYKTVSQEELLDVFWPDNGRNNPGNALRTTIFRIRTALEEGGLPDAENLLIYNNGGYAWNKAVDCVIDSEEFESLCQKAGASSIGPDKKLEILLEAAELYRGDFLPNAGSELWAMRITSYYRSMYINCAHSILELMTDAGRHDEAELFCIKALRIDPFDEKINEYHMLSLLSQRKHAEALAEYKKMEALFYNELGEPPTQGLRSLYQQIYQPKKTSGKHTAAGIPAEWPGEADIPGAYYCDPDMFNAFCRIEALSANRSGKSVFIIRFDVHLKTGKATGMVMEELGNAISNNLRRGDIFTRSSPSQYMLMLQNLTYENCKALPDRIIQSLGDICRPSNIDTTIRPIKAE